MTSRKQLIVNADDFGFTRDVNQGIIEAHRRGILTATTLMANGEAFEDAVRLAQENPALDVGCHLVLVSGRSVLDPGVPLPATATQLVAALLRREIRVYDELAAQVRRIVSAGIRPVHLDTHKHTHLAPPVLDAAVKVAAEFGIRWIRKPFDLPLKNAGQASAAAPPFTKRLTARVLRLLNGRFERVIAAAGCRATDHFTGFQLTGRFGTPELVDLIASLPPGTTELMAHPGICGDELRAAITRLKESRERELEALTAPETREALERHGVELVRYSQIR